MQILLRCVVRRSVEVVPAARFIDERSIDDVVLSGRQFGFDFAVSRANIRLPPTFLFADEDEGFAVANPMCPRIDAVAADGPRLVDFTIDAFCVAIGRR